MVEIVYRGVLSNLFQMIIRLGIESAILEHDCQVVVRSNWLTKLEWDYTCASCCNSRSGGGLPYVELVKDKEVGGLLAISNFQVPREMNYSTARTYPQRRWQIE